MKKRDLSKTAYGREIAGKCVLVIGAGISGVGSVSLLRKAGANPLLLEQNEKRTEEEVRLKLREEDRADTRIVIGALPEESRKEIALVVPSPAVPLDTPFMRGFYDDGIPVISEVELAARFMAGTLVAITGTNGKTTTTTLVGEILKARPAYDYGKKVFVVGNIGDSFALHAPDTTADSVSVAEISSFQLEAVERFHARVSCILNITPDHLDRHHTMEAYAAAKMRIANRQTKGTHDFCVLNYADPLTRAFGEKECGAEVIWFSSDARPPQGLLLRGDEITVVGLGNEDHVLMRFSECRLKGRCNAENVMAALGIVIGLGFEPFTAIDVIRSFPPVPHRIEYIATKGGVEYYNDSKATNPDAAIQGILAMDRQTVLIGGGYDKQADYTDWVTQFAGRVKELVLIGQTKEKIAECAKKCGFDRIHTADDFDDALRYATRAASPGDAVLLSPACASWDMFSGYEARGDCFREYVLSLEADR